MDVYFFDCDKTLYDYDFHKRLPKLAELGGVSQYRLASSWWAGGHERAAEIGEYSTSEEYLEAFAELRAIGLVQIFGDDRRARNRRLAVQHHHRRGARRIHRQKRLVAIPDPFLDEFGFQPVLAECEADETGMRTEGVMEKGNHGHRVSRKILKESLKKGFLLSLVGGPRARCRT